MEILNHTPVCKRWSIAAPIPPEINQELADFPPLLRQLLYNRGVRDAETALAFLSASAPEATDPFLIRDMPQACLLYTSDAADELLCLDLGGRRLIKKKTNE